uniref:Cyclin Dx n=1 Tax=Sphaeramia orbicularis TaxID=375764 RepID=A0A672Z147_9TELE
MSVSLWCEGEVRRQLRAAWDPLCQGHRVIQRLLQVEERYMPSMLYVTLIQRDPERREELTKWAMEVRKLSPPSLLPVISSCSCLPVCLCPSSPYCLAAGCVLSASKLTECDNVTADTLSCHPGPSAVGHSISDSSGLPPHFVASVVESRAADSDCEELLSTLRRHSDTLSAMCACDSAFLGAPPSLVAAASLNCALRGLGNKEASELVHMTEALAELCQTDPVMLQCYSEMIEYALRQRLRSGLQQGPMEKDEEMEPERPGTPTDMREIDF